MWRLHLRQQPEMLLFLSLLMMSLGLSQETFADLFPCSNNETRQGLLHFASNSQMSICCQLRDNICNTTTSSDELLLLPNNGQCQGSCITEKMTRLNKCLVKFEVNNTTSANEGDYSCSYNGQVFALYQVFIIEKPVVPNITLFSYNLNTTMTVKFDRGVPSKTYTDSYYVKMTLLGTTTTLCTENVTSTMCMPNERICTCQYLNSWISASFEVTITVIVLRTVQSSEFSKNYTIGAVIVPGPVMRLRFTDIHLHDTNIQFCMDDDTAMTYPLMDMSPLHFHLRIYRTQGIPEVVNVAIIAKLTDLMWSLKCIRLHVDGLTAFTNYTVVAFTSGGGGESEKKMLNFTTDKMVPAHPPLTDKSSFSRVNKTNVNPIIALVLMWQPLPFAAQGGSNFSYYLEVESESGFRLKKNLQDTFIAIMDNSLPQDRLVAKIWSENDMGRSTNYTTIEIPSESARATPKPYVIVEINEDKAVAYVDITLLKKDTLLAIHWCSDYEDINNELSVCQEYPQSTNYTIIAGNDSIQIFEIDINKADTQKDTSTFNKLLQYSELRYLDASGRNKTVNASVTLSPIGVDASPSFSVDYDDYEATFDPLKDFSYYESGINDRKKRDVVTRKTNIRAFSSLENIDGSWNSGMMPVNCYFDRKKGINDLTAWVVTDKSDMSVSLHWSQKCNPTTAVEFLAKSFILYSSTDVKCNDKKRLNRVENNFQTSVYKLPDGLQFACIQSCRVVDECSSKLTVTAIYPQGVAKLDSTIITPVICTVVLVCVAFCLCFGIYKWKQRGKLLNKMIEQPKMLGFPDELIKNVQDAPGLPQKPELIQHSISNLSEDSGRGTVLCEDDSLSHKNQSSSSEFHSEEKSNSEESSGSFEGEGTDVSSSAESSSTGSSSAGSSGAECRNNSGRSLQHQQEQEKALEMLGFRFKRNRDKNPLDCTKELQIDSEQDTGLGASDGSNQKNRDNISDHFRLEKSETEEDDETEGSYESESDHGSKFTCRGLAIVHVENKQQKALKMNKFSSRRKSSPNLHSLKSARQFEAGERDLNLNRSQRRRRTSPEICKKENREMNQSSNGTDCDVSCSDSDRTSLSDIEIVIAEHPRRVDSESEQMKVLKSMGLDFKKGRSQASPPHDSAQTYPADLECGVFTDSTGNHGDNHLIGENIHNNSIHNSRLSSSSSLQRLMSSESESDGDCNKRSLLPFKHHVNHIC